MSFVSAPRVRASTRHSYKTELGNDIADSEVRTGGLSTGGLSTYAYTDTSRERHRHTGKYARTHTHNHIILGCLTNISL